MLFARTRYANKLLDMVGVPYPSKLRNVIVEMLIYGAKVNERTLRKFAGKRLHKEDAILLVALGLHRNETALANLVERTGLSGDDAFYRLWCLRLAAAEYARMAGRERLLEIVLAAESGSAYHAESGLT